MKKLILSVALLAGMTFVACSSDDDKGNSNCETCRVTFEGETESYKVCKNSDGNAEVSGEDTGIAFEEYMEMMCD